MSKGFDDSEILKIKQMYNEGVARGDIADKLFLCEATVNKLIREMLENGELSEREEKRKTRYHDIGDWRVKQLKKAERKRRALEDEAEGEGGVRCTVEVAKKCLYGCLYAKHHKCEYSLITGKCRTVEDKRSGYNPPTHCQMFTPATPKQKQMIESRIATIPSYCMNARKAEEDEEYLLRMFAFDGLLPTEADDGVY